MRTEIGYNSNGRSWVISAASTKTQSQKRKASIAIAPVA